MKQKAKKKTRIKQHAGKLRGQKRRRAVKAIFLSLSLVLTLLSFIFRLDTAVIIAWAVLAMLVLCVRPFRPAAPGVLALAALCVSLAVADYVVDHYAWSDGRLVPRYALVRTLQVMDSYPEHFTEMEGLEDLDMRGSAVTDFSPVSELTGLKTLDVRDNPAFTQTEFEKLSQALPDCLIRWSVWVGDACFDSDAEEVDLTGLSLSISQIRDLTGRFPATRFTYLVPLLGGRYPQDAQALDLQGAALDADALAESLTLLDQVREIDLQGQPASVETIASFRAAWPDIHFLFTCDVPGGALTTEDSVMTVSGGWEDLTAYLAFAQYLPGLERIDASAVALTGAQLDELLASEYADRLTYSVTAFGRQYPCDTVEMNLDGVAIADAAEVEECIARLPGLKKISMCDCGLSEAEMGRLFDAYPEIKFVWWVEFGKYRLRTDATSFTTNLWDGNEYHYNSDTFAPLRYCTDLMMLDLGHNEITSLEHFRCLKKLRVLILADNQITDISALQDMQDLEYVELFLNYIRDLSPLVGKTKLVDLNVFYNQLSGSCEALKTMTSLRRLWVGHCHLSEDQLAELREALPDTVIMTEGHGSTGNGWREHSHYDTLVRMYYTGEYIPFPE